jgi:hypothetical protein
MRTRWLRYLAIAAAPTLFLAACPAEEAEVAEPEEPADEAVAEEAEEPGDGPPMFTDPSISDLDIVFERDRFTILLHTLPAQDRLWSDTFDNVNVVYSDDPVAPLVGGAAWIVQAEPGIMWPALEQGIVDGVITGITDDKEFWYLMAREGIEEPEDLIGAAHAAGRPAAERDTLYAIRRRYELPVAA